MPPKNCTVCGSPSAANFHFGARSCKACAAFFRRSIKTEQNYGCIGDPTQTCEINHVFRVNCRHCRFTKCLQAGMNEDLVQGRSGTSSTVPRKIIGKRMSPVEEEEPPVHYQPNKYYHPPSTSHEYVDIYNNASDNEWDGYHPPTKIMRTSSEDLMEMDELHEFITIPSHVKMTDNYEEEERLHRLAAFYMDQVVNLNMRRKLTYTEKQLGTMFDGPCACPFEKSDLKSFDIRTYRRRNRNDHTMILDYVNRFPDFQRLNKSEKTVLFQTAAAVDTLVSPSFYSQVIFPTEPFYVTPKGEYLQMRPPPKLELDVFNGDYTPEDQTRNKTLLLMIRRKWEMVVLPLRRLKMSLAEFSLFKALTIWHYNYYKMQDNGRQISAHQRDEIFRALLLICEDEGHVDPLLRVSEIVLAVGIVMAEVHEMVISFIEIMVFDDVDDPILRDMLKFQY